MWLAWSQFDVGQWLEKSCPALSQRTAFIEILASAVYMCGPQPSENLHLVFQVRHSPLT